MNRQLKGAASAAFAALLWTGSAWAGPADYVFTPAVEYGEREIDFKLGSVKRSDEDRSSAASIGFGLGATEYWFTELYAKYKREGSTYFDAFEWENKFQLTQPGQYPVDVGFIVEIERPKDRGEGYEIKFGPLFQGAAGKAQLNGNLLLQRNYRAEAANFMQLAYQWQAKYRLRPQFEFGLQGFGELGRLSHIAPRDEQSHRFGPAVFGKFYVGGRQFIQYNAAYLIDASDARHSKTFRMQVEYEF